MSATATTNLPIAPGVTFNPDMCGGLFVIECGGGYTTQGKEFTLKRCRGYSAWVGIPANVDADTPPAELWAAYHASFSAARDKHTRTGQRCPIELIPELTGREGARIEITTREGHKRRCWVGKSSGWCPCHLEVKTKRSTGGEPLFLSDGDIVRFIEGDGVGFIYRDKPAGY